MKVIIAGVKEVHSRIQAFFRQGGLHKGSRNFKISLQNIYMPSFYLPAQTTAKIVRETINGITFPRSAAIFFLLRRLVTHDYYTQGK